MNIVLTENLTKVYHAGMKKGGVTALDELSIGITSGEIFGLLGPNGAGKTTLFKVLLGITQKSSGKATLMGVSAGKPESRNKIGYLPENHRFPDHLTGKGLISLTGKMCGVSKSDINERIEHLLELVDMSRWGETKIKKYSKGMLQRIGLAQAMINDPEVLFLDEPTDGVDPVGKAEIKEAMIKIREQGKTIILNSHLLSEVETVADRVGILSRGRLVRIGTVDELTSRKLQYEIIAKFGEQLFKVSEDVGTMISLARDRLVVELIKEDGINHIIDQIRIKKIPIVSVKPLKISLEQSFMETIGDRNVGGV